MFQKGNPGGPGRPPVVNSLSDILRKKLEELDASGVPRKQVIAERLLMLAETTDEKVAVKAIKDIFDRLEGSPKQTIDAEVTEKRPVLFDEELKGTTE